MSLEKSNIQFQNTRERTKIANSLKLHKQGCYCLSKHLFCSCNNHEGVNKKNQSLFFHSGDCWYSIHAVLQSFYRRSGKLCRSAREQALMRRRSRAGTQEEHAGQLWRAIWVRAYLQVLEDPVEGPLPLLLGPHGAGAVDVPLLLGPLLQQASRLLLCLLPSRLLEFDRFFGVQTLVFGHCPRCGRAAVLCHGYVYAVLVMFLCGCRFGVGQFSSMHFRFLFMLAKLICLLADWSWLTWSGSLLLLMNRHSRLHNGLLLLHHWLRFGGRCRCGRLGRLCAASHHSAQAETAQTESSTAGFLLSLAAGS